MEMGKGQKPEPGLEATNDAAFGCIFTTGGFSNCWVVFFFLVVVLPAAMVVVLPGGTLSLVTLHAGGLWLGEREGAVLHMKR